MLLNENIGDYVFSEETSITKTYLEENKGSKKPVASVFKADLAWNGVSTYYHQHEEGGQT
jgi:hypothetical protein